MTITRLKESDFYWELMDSIKAFEYYINEKNDELVQLYLEKWNMAKLALKLMFNKTYAFTRTDTYFGIVNEADESDWLYKEMR